MIFTGFCRKCKLLPLKLFYKEFEFSLTGRHQVIPSEIIRVVAGRNLHLTVPRTVKSFQDKENEYAHAIMENNPAFSDTVRKHPLQAANHPLGYQSISQPFEEFRQVTKQATPQFLNLEDKKFSPLVGSIAKHLPLSNDDDILNLLHCLCFWPPTRKSFTPNFKTLWNGIDSECCRRLESWTVTRKLLVSDYWFHLRLSRISQYNKNLTNDLLVGLRSLSEHQVVQLMFLVNLQRQIPQTHLKRLEEKITHILPSITIEEIGILCLGFFKTEVSVTGFRLVKSIMDRFMLEIELINNATAVAILKFLKKSMNLNRVDAYVPLLHKCVQCIPHWDVLASVHLALLSAECHVYHPLLLNAVTEKLANQLKDARIKDGMKLLQCLSHFNHLQNSKFHSGFLEEVQKKSREDEILRHPRDVVFSTMYNAYLGIYNYNMLRTVLEPSFVNQALTKSPESDHTLAEIDYCIQIECPDYDGPRLNKTRLQALNGRRGNFFSSSKNSNTQIRLTREVFHSLEDLMGGQDNIMVRHVLPHVFSPDIVVRLTSNEQSLAKLYGSMSPQSILSPPEDELWACFVIGVPFNFAFKSKQLIGVTGMKLRQLQKLGYKTIFLPFYDMPFSADSKKKYIKEKLQMLQNDSSSDVSIKL